MALSPCSPPNTIGEKAKDEQTYHQHGHHIKTPPQKSQRWPYTCLHRYHGLRSASTATNQHQFSPLPGDVLLATLPRAGTAWLKALAFAVFNRHDDLPPFNPDECVVPFLESQLLYANDHRRPASPVLLATHLPYSDLPSSIVSGSECKIVYAYRNPRGTFVSLWHFVNKIIPTDSDASECSLLDGRSVHLAAGPGSDHVLQYWKASRASPRKVLFLRYEELKREPAGELRRLAEFMGRPFSEAEVREGAVEKILEMCRLEKRRSLKVHRPKWTEI